MTEATENQALGEAIAQARSDPALGRSARVRSLFDYLAASSLEGRSPKEAEVAIEVFGRLADFDSSRDAIVRVYVHKLRQRLEEMARTTDNGLTIPRGEYRLLLRETESTVLDSPARRWPGRAATLLAGLLAAIVVWTALPEDTATGAAKSAIWSGFLKNGRPTIIALGDYYIFADMEAPGGAPRLVREYTVNSSSDLDRYRRENPERAAGYRDLALNYLPVGSADAIASVTPLTTNLKGMRVLPASKLTPTMLRDSNIIYIGFLSGLGLLRDPTFAGSRYMIGETYDDIVDTVTSERFASGGGTPERSNAIYPDFGYLATFAGPTGNRIVIIAGTRDAALSQMGHNAVNAAVLDKLASTAGKGRSVEALFGIKAINDINIDSRLIRSTPMDQSKIWEQESSGEKAFPQG